MPDGTQSWACPAQLVDDESVNLVRTWYRHYKNGVLPASGGLLDQTHYYIEAMSYIDTLLHG